MASALVLMLSIKYQSAVLHASETNLPQAQIQSEDLVQRHQRSHIVMSSP